jgi:hypothetical protein
VEAEVCVGEVGKVDGAESNQDLLVRCDFLRWPVVNLSWIGKVGSGGTEEVCEK